MLKVYLRSKDQLLLSYWNDAHVHGFNKGLVIIRHHCGTIRAALLDATFEYAVPWEFDPEDETDEAVEMQQLSEQTVAGYLKITVSDATVLTLFEPK